MFFLPGRFYNGPAFFGTLNMETLFMLIIAAVAVYYLYRKLIKTGGCSCGDGACCSSSKSTKESAGCNPHGSCKCTDKKTEI
jgi:hypothetical protein